MTGNHIEFNPLVKLILGPYNDNEAQVAIDNLHLNENLIILLLGD